MQETSALLDLEKQLRTAPDLAGYDVEIYPEIISVFGADPGKLDHFDARSSLHICYSQIQLMENVFLGIRLGEHHGHPMNRGWMNLFRRWANADTFWRWWPVLQGTFSRTFVEFAERHLHLPTHAYGRREFPVAGIKTLRAQLDREWIIDPSLPEQFENALHRPLQISLPTGGRGAAVWLAWVLGAIGSSTAILPFPDGELIGVATLSLQAARVWQVHGWVKIGYRGVGIGNHLFERALCDIQYNVNLAGEASVNLVVDLGPGPGGAPGSDVHNCQMEYIQFYERIGFRRTHAGRNEPSRLFLSRTVTRN